MFLEGISYIQTIAVQQKYISKLLQRSPRSYSGGDFLYSISPPEILVKLPPLIGPISCCPFYGG